MLNLYKIDINYKLENNETIIQFSLCFQENSCLNNSNLIYLYKLILDIYCILNNGHYIEYNSIYFSPNILNIHRVFYF